MAKIEIDREELVKLILENREVHSNRDDYCALIHLYRGLVALLPKDVQAELGE